MEPPPKPQSGNLFQVYLRLRPPPASQSLYSALNNLEAPPRRFLSVEEAIDDMGYEQSKPTHITIVPPPDPRKRAVEKFAFTQVFEEDASQKQLFQSTGVVPLIQGVLGPDGKEGRDGLFATLGVTGSGKASLKVRGHIMLNTDNRFYRPTQF
jgi:hypothetical protein